MDGFHERRPYLVQAHPGRMPGSMGMGLSLSVWMAVTLFCTLFGLTIVGCSGFDPKPLEAVPIEKRALRQTQGQVTIASVALTEEESEAVYGVDLGKTGIQPVWLQVENNTPSTYWLIESSLDPDYFSPLEAAYENHVLFDDSTNHHMDNYFVQQAFKNPVGPHSTESGFVLVNLSRGRKFIHVALLSPGHVKGFDFILPVPGLKADHLQVDFDRLYTDEELIYIEDHKAFRMALQQLPCCTTNEDGTENGDPLNLVIIGPQGALEPQFLSRGWYETEVIYEGSIWKTVQSFFFGSHYRHSPVSPLYLFGRPQDLAIQKPRRTIDKRNHLRLWLSPYRFRGERVWVGQISRDIGVRLTTKTWSFTTHRIDPDVDEARNFLVADLLYTGGIEKIGWVAGLGVAKPDYPQWNLTGDPYFHDGLRVVLLLSKDYTAMSDVRFLDWEDPSLKKSRHFRKIQNRP